MIMVDRNLKHILGDGTDDRPRAPSPITIYTPLPGAAWRIGQWRAQQSMIDPKINCSAAGDR